MNSNMNARIVAKKKLVALINGAHCYVQIFRAIATADNNNVPTEFGEKDGDAIEQLFVSKKHNVTNTDSRRLFCVNL